MGASEIVAGGFRRLDPGYIAASRLTGWVMFGAIIGAWAVVFAFVLWLGEEGLRGVQVALLAIGVLLVGPLWWAAARWPELHYEHCSYRLDETGIEIRSGVWFRTVTTVPRSRVQHTDVTQGPIERRFHLGTLIIYTAGTEHASVTLPGLEHGMALWIRDALLPKHGSDAV